MNLRAVAHEGAIWTALGIVLVFLFWLDVYLGIFVGGIGAVVYALRRDDAR